MVYAANAQADHTGYGAAYVSDFIQELNTVSANRTNFSPKLCIFSNIPTSDDVISCITYLCCSKYQG